MMDHRDREEERQDDGGQAGGEIIAPSGSVLAEQKTEAELVDTIASLPGGHQSGRRAGARHAVVVTLTRPSHANACDIFISGQVTLFIYIPVAFSRQ